MDVSGKNSDLLLRLMDASILRGRVLGGNMANQSTAGYLRREVSFEETLAERLSEGQPLGELKELTPQVSIDKDATVKADGNSVEMEAEVTASRENRLIFELYAAMLRGQSRLSEIAIRSDR